MHCRHCGRTLEVDAAFCAGCGRSVGTDESVPTSVATPDGASRLRQIEYRLAKVEARLPQSNIISTHFWTRAFAVWGHALVIQVIIYGVILALWMLVFGLEALPK
jgi:uncharacterized membrane protein YvbJ